MRPNCFERLPSTIAAGAQALSDATNALDFGSKKDDYMMDDVVNPLYNERLDLDDDP